MRTPQSSQQHTQAIAPADVSIPADTLTALHQFALALAARPALDATLALALRTAAQITASSHATLLLLDAAEQIYYRVALDNGNLAPLALVAQPMMRRGLAGWVVRERRATIVCDTAYDDRWLPGPGLGDLRSALVVPSVYSERVLGILTLGHEAPEHYRAADLDVIEIIGAQIALALELAEHNGLSLRPAPLPRTDETVVLAAELRGLSVAAHALPAPTGFAELISAFFQSALEIVARYGGSVAAISGDALLAVFSAADGAACAAAAAAELVVATQRLRAHWHARFATHAGTLNIGIGDGALTLGTLPSTPPTVHLSGGAAERARRLCELARDEVLVTPPVARALAEHPDFVLRALPPLELERGLRLPIFQLLWRPAPATALPGRNGHAAHGVGAMVPGAE